MKKLISIFILILISKIIFSQNFPYGINYQAVARDANGNAKTNQNLNIVRFSINKNSVNGPLIWQETHNGIITNSMGQFNVIIGSGTTTGGGSASSFSSIDWALDVHWLTVEFYNGVNFTPIASQQFQSVPYALAAKHKSPTIQRFTSGSGTYITPLGVQYIRVRMVGGGGGGAGSGSTSGTPSSGSSSLFGSNLLTANGGTPGSLSTGGQGGNHIVNPPANNIQSNNGGQGSGPGQLFQAAYYYNAGGSGGDATFFGGGGKSAGFSNNGSAGMANTGGGGQGGGLPGGIAGTQNTGGGGGAGAFIDALIYNPLPSYSYTVGTGGNGGSGSQYNGGAGGSGIIIIEEYY